MKTPLRFSLRHYAAHKLFINLSHGGRTEKIAILWRKSDNVLVIRCKMLTFANINNKRREWDETDQLERERTSCLCR